MSFFDDVNMLKGLQDMLYPKEDSESSDEEYTVSKCKTTSTISPGDIGKEPVKKERQKKSSPYAKLEETPKEDLMNGAKSIEEWLDKQEEEDANSKVHYKEPQYSVKFQQAVGTEHIYLQMSNKSPATASCEDMVIEIYMPDEIGGADNMKLSITETEIDLKSPSYRFKLPLVHNVDPDQGTAKFDPDTKTMRLTLRMKRELDFVNF